MTANNDLYNKSSGPSHQHPDVNVCVCVCPIISVFSMESVSMESNQRLTDKTTKPTNLIFCSYLCVMECVFLYVVSSSIWYEVLYTIYTRGESNAMNIYWVVRDCWVCACSKTRLSSINACTTWRWASATLSCTQILVITRKSWLIFLLFW